LDFWCESGVYTAQKVVLPSFLNLADRITFPQKKNDSLLSLHETGITLSGRNFLEGQNQTVKEYIVSLTVLVVLLNSQGNI
jgi:hypothetical protein